MRFRLLDSFRGIASMWVFLFHFNFENRLLESCPPLKTLFDAGHFGVPMFFVISGFCLMASASSCIAKDQHTTLFLRRRLRRIYPPYWLSLCILVAPPYAKSVIRFFATGSFEWPQSDALPYSNLSLLDWAGILTLTRAFDPSSVKDLWQKFADFNPAYWSLAIEVQFYLAVALGLVWRSGFKVILGIITALAVIAVFVPGSFEHGIFLPYWPGFAFGGILYFLLEAKVTPSSLVTNRLTRATGIAFILAVGAWSILSAAAPSLRSIVFAAAFTALLWLLFEHDEWMHSSDSPRVLRWLVGGGSLLGLMSYSIYLLHNPLQYQSADIIGYALNTKSLFRDSLEILMTVILCVPFYWLCERPFCQPASKVKIKVAGAQNS